MPEIIPERVSAQVDGDFVVFLIGMRINKPWKIHKWLPVALSMPRMLKELEKNPELGLLSYETGSKFIVQYWRSFEALEAYAQSKTNKHLPAWAAFNKKLGKSRGEVGIWHETYLVKAGQYEAVYSGMPKFGLGKVGELVPATGDKKSARERVESN